MTPPVFLAPELAEAAAGDVLRVTGEEGRHGAAALRIRPGEPVTLVDGAGRRVIGEVADAGRDWFTVAVSSVRDEPEPPLRVTVVQALAKGDRSEVAVDMLTECGADRIVPWAAARSVTEWRPDRVERGLRRWRAVARSAGKQSRRSRVPVVTEPASNREVAGLLAAATLGIVLHEDAAARLAHVTVPPKGDVVVVVGPEGGISTEELELFSGAGGLPVRMGESILRTSTAGVAALAVILAAGGRWD